MAVVVLVLIEALGLFVVSDERVWLEADWFALIEANNPFNRSCPPPEPPEMESDIFYLPLFLTENPSQIGPPNTVSHARLIPARDFKMVIKYK